MTVSPYLNSMLVDYGGAVSLADYANIININECGIWGVNNPNSYGYETCNDIWSKWERDQLARYLAEAQKEIEDEIGYFLYPRWVVGQIADEPNGDERYIDSQEWSQVGSQITRWSVLISGGVRAESNIALSETINTATDPGIVGPVATTVTDPNEIKIFYPGTDIEIRPSKITISGGQVTIEVPRCRTVIESAANNPSDGIVYGNLANFLTAVDIKRVYNDPSTQAELVWPHICNSGCSVSGCSEKTQTACIYIRDEKIGVIDAYPADYSSGSWTQKSISCCCGAKISRLNYYSGVYHTMQAQDAIIRLAHSKMPKEPCQCDKSGAAWKMDNIIPDAVTRERINCRFGMSNGAWTAWQFAQAMKNVRGGGVL